MRAVVIAVCVCFKAPWIPCATFNFWRNSNEVEDTVDDWNPDSESNEVIVCIFVFGVLRNDRKHDIAEFDEDKTTFRTDSTKYIASLNCISALDLNNHFKQEIHTLPYNESCILL